MQSHTVLTSGYLISTSVVTPVTSKPVTSVHIDVSDEELDGEKGGCDGQRIQPLSFVLPLRLSLQILVRPLSSRPVMSGLAVAVTVSRKVRREIVDNERMVWSRDEC